MFFYDQFGFRGRTFQKFNAKYRYVLSRNYRLYKNRNFCKGAKMSKDFSDAKEPAWSPSTKRITRFSRMRETFKLLRFGILIRNNMFMSAFSLMCCNTYNSPLNLCILKTFNWIAMSMFIFGNKCIIFFVITPVHLFVCVPTDRTT